MTNNTKDFPSATLSIPYPPRSNKLTAFFRIFCAIPVLFLLCLIMGMSTNEGMVIGGGVLVLPTILMIVFRGKYPKVWFEWNYYLVKFTTRVFAYLFLLRDEYPAIEDDQYINLTLKYPNVAKELNQGMPLYKWILAIPHYLVLIVLFVAVVIVTIIAWFCILFTGKYPQKMHTFVVGVFKWALRVNAYAFLCLTDQYPPFKF